MSGRCDRYRRLAGNVRSGLGGIIDSLTHIHDLAGESEDFPGIPLELKGVIKDLESLRTQAWQVDGHQPREGDKPLEPAPMCPLCKGSGKAQKERS